MHPPQQAGATGILGEHQRLLAGRRELDARCRLADGEDDVGALAEVVQLELAPEHPDDAVAVRHRQPPAAAAQAGRERRVAVRRAARDRDRERR